MTWKRFVKPEDRWWLLLAAISVIAILAAASRWILYHHYGINWDEAEYLNQALLNLRILHSGNLHHIGGMILIGDPFRPPAYRLLVLPFLALFGHSIAVARFMTLAFSALSAWFIYSCTRRISAPVAGIIAALVFCLSTEVVLDSTYFSTEGPLFLATAAMLYFLFTGWSTEGEYKGNWIGLGLAVALGFLSKMTFALIAIPLFVFVVVDAYRRRSGLRGIMPFFKAGIVAFVVGAPWWLLNFRHALGFATHAEGFVRGSLGGPSPVTYVKWLGTVFIGLLGPGVSVFLLCVLVVVVWHRKDLNKRENILGSLQGKVLLACACAGLPLVAAELSSTNQNLRFLSPAVIPLAIAVGILSEKVGLTRSRAFFGLSGVLMLSQVGILVAPVLFPNHKPIDPRLVNGEVPWAVFARFEQWNWKPVRKISLGCGVETPTISYLGNGRAFNLPQIQYPWAARGTPAPSVTWLWRYEQGPLNWEKVMEAAGRSDIVLTAPHYLGQASDKDGLDNQYNAEFAARLSQDPLFRKPIHLELGRFKPVEVDVFVKKTLRCPGEEMSANSDPR